MPNIFRQTLKSLNKNINSIVRINDCFAEFVVPHVISFLSKNISFQQYEQGLII